MLLNGANVVITHDGGHFMRWPWAHAAQPTAIDRAILLAEDLLAEHDRLVEVNERNLDVLRKTVDVATIRSTAKEPERV